MTEENPQTGREHEVGILAAPLLTLDLNREIDQLRSEGRISVQTLAGRIRFNTAERPIELAAGQMLTVERGIPHDVESIVDSAFLLTIAWRDASSARS